MSAIPDSVVATLSRLVGRPVTAAQVSAEDGGTTDDLGHLITYSVAVRPGHTVALPVWDGAPDIEDAYEERDGVRRSL